MKFLDDVSCTLCTYWNQPSLSADIGYCQRYPPVLHPVMFTWVWPITHSNDVCGDFEVADEDDADDSSDSVSVPSCGGW